MKIAHSNIWYLFWEKDQTLIRMHHLSPALQSHKYKNYAKRFSRLIIGCSALCSTLFWHGNLQIFLMHWSGDWRPKFRIQLQNIHLCMTNFVPGSVSTRNFLSREKCPHYCIWNWQASMYCIVKHRKVTVNKELSDEGKWSIPFSRVGWAVDKLWLNVFFIRLWSYFTYCKTENCLPRNETSHLSCLEIL